MRDAFNSPWRKSSYSGSEGDNCIEVAAPLAGPRWHKSTHSGPEGDNCLEVAAVSEDPAWHRSTHSGGQGDNCVETARTPRHVRVRDSKDVGRHPLQISPTAWTTFTTGLTVTHPSGDQTSG